MQKNLVLWRFTWSHAIGLHWLAMRTCRDMDSGLAWLAIFEKDEPSAKFALDFKKPPLLAAEFARHPALIQ